jgi:hypothetical protein
MTNNSSFKVVSIKTALFNIYQQLPNNELIDEGYVKDKAIYAATALLNHKYYSHNVCIKVIDNHKAELPSNYHNIDFVLYKEDLDDTLDLNNPKVISITDNDYSEVNTKIITKVIDTNLGWNYMYLGKAQQAITQRNCIGGSCNEYYSLTFDNQLLTTINQGYVAIFYTGLPYNEEGDLMIPFNQAFIDAIESYVLMCYFMRLYNMGQEGAERRAMTYTNKWQSLYLNVKSNLMMPTMSEYVNMIENIKLSSLGSSYSLHNQQYNERIY